jgi:rubrerythrin
MSPSQIGASNGLVVRNLSCAYEGESNAHARYTAFAHRADADGLHGAASLFRAAARAELIHANNHARVIHQLGGQPSAQIFAVNVRSTLQNLKAARAGEQHEIQAIYPRFVRQAQAHANVAAARSFVWALEAEKTHAQLYNKAIALLDTPGPDSWHGKSRDFYVCPMCGYTTETFHVDRCPVCTGHGERFELVR